MEFSTTFSALGCHPSWGVDFDVVASVIFSSLQKSLAESGCIVFGEDVAIKVGLRRAEVFGEEEGGLGRRGEGGVGVGLELGFRLGC